MYLGKAVLSSYAQQNCVSYVKTTSSNIVIVKIKFVSKNITFCSRIIVKNNKSKNKQTNKNKSKAYIMITLVMEICLNIFFSEPLVSKHTELSVRATVH